jgi:hypothetical protein
MRLEDLPLVQQRIVCHHCGERKTVTTHAGIIVSYCSERCKRNAGNRRRKLRRRQRQRGEIVPCPHPDKVPYATREMAEAAAHNELVANGRVRYVHDKVCRCGSWHVSSMSRRAPEPDKPSAGRTDPVPSATALSPDQVAALLDRFPREERR